MFARFFRPAPHFVFRLPADPLWMNRSALRTAHVSRATTQAMVSPAAIRAATDAQTSMRCLAANQTNLSLQARPSLVKQSQAERLSRSESLLPAITRYPTWSLRTLRILSGHNGSKNLRATIFHRQKTKAPLLLRSEILWKSVSLPAARTAALHNAAKYRTHEY